MTKVASEILRARIDLSDAEVNKICDVVREVGFDLHKFLGPGFREKVYERGMIHRLQKAGLFVRAQTSVMIHDEDGTELVEEIMDLMVEDVLILELKAVRETTDTDVAQLLGYLRAAQYRHGLLINFGAPRFYIKKYVR